MYAYIQEWDREEMTLACLGHIRQGLWQSSTSSRLLYACRRGSPGLQHQRKNLPVWLERRQCMKNGGKRSGGEGK